MSVVQRLARPVIWFTFWSAAVQIIHLSFWFTLIFRRRWKKRGCPLRYTHTHSRTHTHTLAHTRTRTHTEAQFLSPVTLHLWCSQPSSSSSFNSQTRVKVRLLLTWKSVSSFFLFSRLLFAEVEMIHFQICCCANDSLEFLIHFHFQTEVKEDKKCIPSQNY